MKDIRQKCYCCDDSLDDKEHVHKISYGSWNEKQNTYQREPQEKYYCRECWSDKKPLNDAIEFWVETPEQLFETLDSSDGEITVDFGSHTLGSKSFVTVVDSNIYLCASNLRRITDDFISTYYTYKQMDKQDFDDFVSQIVESELPSYVYLRNSDNTPFSGYNFIEEEQSKIENFTINK